MFPLEFSAQFAVLAFFALTVFAACLILALRRRRAKRRESIVVSKATWPLSRTRTMAPGPSMNSTRLCSATNNSRVETLAGTGTRSQVTRPGKIMPTPFFCSNP